jgi:hypothetical protein
MPTAGGSYAGRTTGAGAPIPAVSPGGPPDINAIMGGWVDRGIWPFYDTLKLSPGTTVNSSYSFFSVSKGQADPNLGSGAAAKTYVETNLLTPGQFNPPRDLILKAIGFQVFADTRLYDIEQIFKHSYFEFKIDEKVFFQGPMELHPSGMGFAGMSTQTAESSWTNGYPGGPAFTRRFGDFSKYIAPLMLFSLTLYFPETVGQYFNNNLTAQQTLEGQVTTNTPTLLTLAQGGNGVVIRAILDGLSDRSVQ